MCCFGFLTAQDCGCSRIGGRVYQSILSSQNWRSLSIDRSQLSAPGCSLHVRLHQATQSRFRFSLTGAEATSFRGCPDIQKFVHYSEKGNEKLPGILKMVEVDIPANSIFVGHGHLPHACAYWDERPAAIPHLCRTIR